MQRDRTRAVLLWLAATDATFEPVELPGGPALLGKCIHCNRKHALLLDGTPLSRSTIEHIVPQCHGGTGELANLAIACSGCNSQKGVRHDGKRRDDPKLAAMIELLQRRKQERLRPPLAGLALPRLRSAPAAAEEKQGRPGKRRR